jgi:UDP-glucose 4-epimerase
MKTVAVFGGSGKVGRQAIPRLLARGLQVSALVHHTPLASSGVRSVSGSITDPAAVRETVTGAQAVIQLATTKEDPDSFFDVSVRGTLNVLEACRAEGVEQFILLGGDAAFGIWFYPQPIPIDENHPLMAYPGYYAFTKVMEEVMTQQYGLQYGVPWTILRSSWIFQDDDLLRHFSLLRNVDPAEPGHGFGQMPEPILDLVRAGREHVPILVNAEGVPYRRHIVHMQDVLQALDLALDNPSALGQSFNIAAPAPFEYRVAAQYLAAQLELPTLEVPCPGYHSFEINITRARTVLGYTPAYDFFAIADAALQHR